VPARGILIDSGPLVAILNERDQYHNACRDEAKQLHGEFCTSWPVITEAAHLLKFRPTAVQTLLAWVRTTELQILPLAPQETDRIATILRDYSDQGFDFADATLMYLAERETMSTIFTIDRRHFSVFRTKTNQPLNIVPAAI